MRNATALTVSTYGVIAGLAGIEHGIGEFLQGNIAPRAFTILSWPDAEAFRILGGEPAMTLVPNLRTSGVLAIVASLLFLVWAALFVQRRHGGLVLILLSLLMLLVGGGFGPPLLGVILGTTATRIHAPMTWWRTRLSTGARNALRAMWPWSYAAGIVAWLMVFPGTVLLVALFGVDGSSSTAALATSVLILCAFGLLLLTIVTGFAHDSGRQVSAPVAVR